MSSIAFRPLFHSLLLTAAGLASMATSPARAIDFDDVRPFEEVFRISAAAPSRDRIEVRWDIADEHYLYNNRFLGFTTTTPGVTIGSPDVPEGEREWDELLGEEVIKFRDQLVVGLPLAVEAGIERVALEVRSQGCLDKVLCYPPTVQELTVALPAGGAGAAGAGNASLDSLMAGDGFAAVADGAPAEGAGLGVPGADAFEYEAIGLDADTILVRFTVAPDHYLYRDHIAFRVVSPNGIDVRAVDLPDGIIKDDPEFGLVPVYRDQVEIPVHVNRPAGGAEALVLEADFQGCEDGAICYPPETRAASLQLEASAEAIELPSLESLATQGGAFDARAAAAGVAVEPPQSEQDRLARLLTDHPTRALLAFFVAGLLLAFTPCVFPMVPILSGIIMGEGERLNTRRAFWLSLIYVLAMALTYTVAGVLAGLFGQNLQAAFQNPWIISGFVAVFIALALSMFGFYELQLPSRWQSKLTEASNQQGGGRLFGVAVMGVLSALIVGPCVAPPLAAALIVIGSSGDPVLGGSALFALSLGMGVPLLAFGASAGRWVPKAGAWMNAVKAFFGVGLLALAIWMLERIVQGPVILLLWGLLAIGSGVYLGAFERLPEGRTGWPALWKALGVVLIIIGTLELVGALSGGRDWLRPLSGLSRPAGEVSEARELHFDRIKSVDDLDQRLAAAGGQPTVLDFYADWCVECIRMERNTFPDPGVQALMAEMQLLQADVTENDDIDQTLMQRFSVIGPPAILFFDRSGNEMPAYRLVGYFTPDEFSAHLERVLAAP